MSVKADTALQQRRVQLRLNNGKQFTRDQTTVSDVIYSNEKVYWYPYWGAFYWMSRGHLILKVDMGYNTAESYVTDPTYDPCQAAYPIFLCSSLNDANCISHVSLDLTGTVGSSSSATIVAQAWVFEFLYLVVGTSRTQIWKIQGDPRNTNPTF